MIIITKNQLCFSISTAARKLPDTAASLQPFTDTYNKSSGDICCMELTATQNKTVCVTGNTFLLAGCRQSSFSIDPVLLRPVC